MKPIFDSLTADQFCAWAGGQPHEIEPGVQVLSFPYVVYHPVVEEWNTAVNCTPIYIDPYREVPGKESGVPPPRFFGLGQGRNPNPDEFFQDAELDEVRQYMAVCLRGEKWCDGHIAGEFKQGVIQVAFRCLETIYSQSR